MAVLVQFVPPHFCTLFCFRTSSRKSSRGSSSRHSGVKKLDERLVSRALTCISSQQFGFGLLARVTSLPVCPGRKKPPTTLNRSVSENPVMEAAVAILGCKNRAKGWFGLFCTAEAKKDPGSGNYSLAFVPFPATPQPNQNASKDQNQVLLNCQTGLLHRLKQLWKPLWSWGRRKTSETKKIAHSELKSCLRFLQRLCLLLFL